MHYSRLQEKQILVNTITHQMNFPREKCPAWALPPNNY
jgi:hypothetical protein